MVNGKILLKRLSVIKLLYKQGLEQSRQSEATSFFSILSFHDSIEMFLKLAAEHKGISTDNLSFLAHWDKMPELTLKESIKNLNVRRVNIKHRGLAPAKVEIEASRVNATDFFEQNTPIIFGISFDKISLFELITFEKTKALLAEAQASFDSDKTEECIKAVTVSFHELIREYKESKSKWGPMGFNFTKKLHVTFLNTGNRNIDDLIRNVSDNFDNINSTLEIMSLGIDFRKYIKFNTLTPFTFRLSNDNYHFPNMGKKNWSKENCQFLIDFVVECAFKFQDFDFDFADLEIVEPRAAATDTPP